MGQTSGVMTLKLSFILTFEIQKRFLRKLHFTLANLIVIANVPEDKKGASQWARTREKKKITGRNE